MNKFYKWTIASVFALIGLAMLSADAWASAAPPSRDEINRVRAERKSAPRRQASTTPKKIMGGTKGDKPLYGMHVKSFYGDEGTGIAKIHKGDYEHVKRFDAPGFQGCWTGDKYLAIFFDAEAPGTVFYAMYNTKTWECESYNGCTINSAYTLPYGLTYDHTTGTIYGCFFESTAQFMASEDAKFGYITNNAFDPTHIINTEQDLPERMRALATDKDGQIWGIGFRACSTRLTNLQDRQKR